MMGRQSATCPASNAVSGRETRAQSVLCKGFTSICLIAFAVAIFWVFFRREPSPIPTSSPDFKNLEAKLSQFCPDDPLLASRLATQWAFVALRVADQEGCLGLQVLDTFGDDAVYLFEKDRAGFKDLQAIIDLNGSIYAASMGPWRKAVLEWAMSGRLRAYRAYIERLGPSERDELRRNPSSLPLLGQDVPIAKQMLTRFGSRAWHLFMLLDFGEGGTEGVERVARCLSKHGEEMLDLNERYGLAVALLFVAPPDDPDERLPDLFRHSIKRLGVEEAAALFLTQYDDLSKLLLEEARSPEDLAAVIDLLAGLQPEIRDYALDSGHTIRLLLQKRGDEHIGFTILRRCGPSGADEIFEPGRYGADPVDREAALLILSRNGCQGLRVLHELHGWGPWHQLLRRADLRASERDPLLCRLVRKIAVSQGKQDEIEAWLKMPIAQIEGLQYPPDTSEKVLEWLPGYLATKAMVDLSRGYHLDRSEIGWAVFDGVMTATMIGELAGQAVKTVGRKAGQKVLTEVERKAATDAISELERQAMRELVDRGSRQATRDFMVRLPGATFSDFLKTLPSQVLKADVTQIMRSASGVAKRVGVRTWGKLDRRIIMRGDRRVLIDLTSPDFLRTLSERARSELLWDSATYTVGEIGPCILERVVPGLRGG